MQFEQTSKAKTSLLFSPPWFRRRNVPFISQNSQTDCGAACLAMILNFHGHTICLRDLKTQLVVGRDGLTAKDIAEAARNFGLRVKAYSTQLEGLQYLALPAIVHWGLDHFVVLEKWSSKGATIVDPSLGRYQPSLDEFNSQFTGVVLALEPGIHFQARKETEPGIWRDYLRQTLRLPGISAILVQVLAASLLLQVLGLVFPIATKLMVDYFLPYRLTQFMPLFGLAILVLLLAYGGILILRSTLLIYLQAKIDSQLMLGFFEHLLKLPFRFFQERATGDLLHRLGSNAALREILTTQSLSTILDGFFVIVYLLILWSQDFLFGLVAGILGCLQIGILFATKSLITNLNHQHLNSQAEAQSYFVEALNGMETLKASGTESRVLDHWSNLFFRQLNVSLRKNYATAMINNFIRSLSLFSPLLLLWIGAFRVLSGDMSLGTMLALLAIAAAFLSPLVTLVSNGQQFQFLSAHLHRLGDILEEPPEPGPAEGGYRAKPKGEVKVDRLWFRYHPKSTWILRDISLSIPQGSKIGIVGPTGSGKSTFAKLLLSLYQPTRGTILVDGVSTQSWNLQNLRQQFGVVPQNCFLFSGSIQKNIALHRPNQKMSEIVRAAQMACIHNDIVALPMGYETPVGEGGQGFSGGQRQRLAIARALSHQPSVLLMDEATSHLDSITEQAIEKNLRGLACTRIVIAHRLSTLFDADLILFLDQGSVIEMGTHDQLMAKEGRYAAMARGQHLSKHLAFIED